MVWKRIIDRSFAYDKYGCVRTIVVWKHKFSVSALMPHYKLRENHSGMETFEIKKEPRRTLRLRENHSGMETCTQLSLPLSFRVA